MSRPNFLIKRWIKKITPTSLRYFVGRKLQLGRDLSHWLAIDGQPQDKQNDIEKMLDFVMSIEGQISRAEAQTLVQLASQVNKDAVIMEIGSYRGRSTIALAFGSRLGHQNRIYSVDPHDEFEGVGGGKFGPEDQAYLYRNIIKAEVGDLVSIISLPSADAARAWSKANIGLLWIDGDHRYEAVRSDFNAWSRYLLPGAVVAFHDVDLLGVRRLIEELLQAGKIVKISRVGLLAWFKYQG